MATLDATPPPELPQDLEAVGNNLPPRLERISGFSRFCGPLVMAAFILLATAVGQAGIQHVLRSPPGLSLLLPSLSFYLLCQCHAAILRVAECLPCTNTRIMLI